MDLIKKNFKVWWLQATYMVIWGGFISILYYHFVKNDISFFYIILIEAVASLLIALYLYFRGKFNSPNSILNSFILAVLAALLLLVPVKLAYIFIPYIIIRYFSAIIFFTVYNILDFRDISEKKYLQNMTFYWGVGAVISLIAPIIGGYIYETWALVGMVLGISLLMLIGIYLTKFLPKEEYKYTKKEIFKCFPGLRTINIIDGGLHRINFVVIYIFSLNYITGGLDYGLFISLSALVGLMVAWPMAKISDRKNKRTIFIWPISIITAIVIGFFYFVNSFYWFLIFALLLKMMTTISDPIRSNVTQDKAPRTPLTWIGREMYLNTGRFFTLLVVAILLYFNMTSWVYVFFACLTLSFLVVVYLKKTYAN